MFHREEAKERLRGDGGRPEWDRDIPDGCKPRVRGRSREDLLLIKYLSARVPDLKLASGGRMANERRGVRPSHQSEENHAFSVPGRPRT